LVRWWLIKGAVAMQHLRNSLILMSALSAFLAGAGVAGPLNTEREDVATSVDCSAFAWPRIPAPCLVGDEHDDIRLVTADRVGEELSMGERFAEAFRE
jgi:hypothetical protein